MFEAEFWVAVAFAIFVGILIYVGVPKMLVGALDDRAKRVRAELDEARRLKEEAQKLLAVYQGKQRQAETEKYMEELKQKREEQFKKAEEEKALRAAEAAKREVEELKREAEAAKAEAARAEAEAAKAAVEAAAKKAETIYVVKSGDNLSAIAKSVYGNAGRWREIYEANKDIIENPNLIRPGWKLRIPD